jgi:chromosome segregation ATPase
MKKLSNMEKDMLDYFEKYRQTKTNLAATVAKIEDLRAQANAHRSKAAELEKDLMAMKRIISVMIEENIDPIEAKLRTSPDDRIDTIWVDELTITTASLDSYNNAYSSVKLSDVSTAPLTMLSTVNSIR